MDVIQQTSEAQNALCSEVDMVAWWIPVAEAMKQGNWPASSLLRIIILEMEERDFRMMMLGISKHVNVFKLRHNPNMGIPVCMPKKC